MFVVHSTAGSLGFIDAPRGNRCVTWQTIGDHRLLWNCIVCYYTLKQLMFNKPHFLYISTLKRTALLWVSVSMTMSQYESVTDSVTIFKFTIGFDNQRCSLHLQEA